MAHPTCTPPSAESSSPVFQLFQLGETPQTNMNAQALETSPSSGNDPDLTGRILRARIVRTWLDHCDVVLIDPETGEEYSTLGRLYQHDSLAWKEPALLGELPDYRQSTAEHPNVLPAVYVTYAREEKQQKHWFVHERWGANNPWDDLALKEDDLVYGTVSREVVAKRTSELVGYLVQLYETAPLLTLNGEEDKEGRRQPDIEVFIPVEELPWGDGAVGGRMAHGVPPVW